MDYHQNARLTIHSRERLARAVVVERCSLKAVAAKWVRRYCDGGPAALSDRSSRPRRCFGSSSSTL
jgi:hypothetical protein